MAVIQRILSYKFFPLCWTLFTVALLCMPGSMVPGTGIFGIPNLDKIVHVILFGSNVLFWGLHYREGGRSRLQLRPIFLITTVFAIVLGVMMEYVQLYFVPNRSFDVGDIMADAAGAVLAGLWLLKS